MSYDLERIQINIQANTSEAVKAYKELAKALNSLKKVSSSDFGFRKLADDTNAFASSIRSNLRTIERYANALDKIARARGTRASGVRKAEKAAGGGKFPENSQSATPIDSKTVEGSADALKEVNKEIDKTNKKLKSANKESKGFLTNLKDIVKYRILRSILSAIGKSMKEGSENFYGFLSMSNNSQASEMKKSLDGISSTLLSLKNTLGVTLLSTAITLKPVIESLSEVMITLVNGINALMAKVKGSTTYFAANREAIKKWSDTVKNSTQSFDELNVLAGNQDTMPSDMYVEKDVDEAIKAFSDEALKIAGVVVAYEGLKKIVELITGAFGDKNKSLKKQSEYTETETSKVTALKEAFAKATSAITDNAGLIAGLGLLGTAIGGISFGSIKDSAGEMQTGVENAFSKVATAIEGLQTNWESKLSSIKSSTEQFVTDINVALSKLGATISVKGATEGAKLGLTGVTSGVGSALSATSSLTSLKPSTSTSTSYPAYNQGVSTSTSKSTSTSNALTSLLQSNPTLFSVAMGLVPNSAKSLLSGALSSSSSGNTIADTIHKFSMDFWDQTEKGFKDGIEHVIDVLRHAPIGGGAFPLLGYASGGFVNSGQLFVAREAGAEMVGSIGGRTAVANNDQITEAIASAVYDAMMAAGGGNVNVTLEGDAKKLFRVVQDEARQYNRKTGSYAFN